VSSNSTVKTVGPLLSRTAFSPSERPFRLAEGLDGYQPHRALKHQGETDHDIVDDRTLDLVWRSYFIDALHNGYTGTDAEDQHGDNEGPKIELQAVAKGMRECGRPRRAPQAEQHQNLIAAVHDGVNRLAQHCGAAGVSGRREFGDGHQKIAGKGGVDDSFRR
jgi:hypothetical protein